MKHEIPVDYVQLQLIQKLSNINNFIQVVYKNAFNDQCKLSSDQNSSISSPVQLYVTKCSNSAREILTKLVCECVVDIELRKFH